MIPCYLFKGNPYKFKLGPPTPPHPISLGKLTLRILSHFQCRSYVLSIYEHCPLTCSVIYVSTGGNQFLPRCKCISADRDGDSGKWPTSGMYSSKCLSVKILSLESIFVRYNLHCCDVIMGATASQINSLAIVYTTVYSGADQRKPQSSASLAFVRGLHRWPVNCPSKGPVTQKILPFDDVIIECIFLNNNYCVLIQTSANFMPKGPIYDNSAIV